MSGLAQRLLLILQSSLLHGWTSWIQWIPGDNRDSNRGEAMWVMELDVCPCSLSTSEEQHVLLLPEEVKRILQKNVLLMKGGVLGFVCF